MCLTVPVSQVWCFSAHWVASASMGLPWQPNTQHTVPNTVSAHLFYVSGFSHIISLICYVHWYKCITAAKQSVTVKLVFLWGLLCNDPMAGIHSVIFLQGSRYKMGLILFILNGQDQFTALLLLPSSAATNLISALAVLEAMLLSLTLCLKRKGKVFLKDFWKLAPMKP